MSRNLSLEVSNYVILVSLCCNVIKLPADDGFTFWPGCQVSGVITWSCDKIMAAAPRPTRAALPDGVLAQSLTAVSRLTFQIGMYYVVLDRVLR